MSASDQSLQSFIRRVHWMMTYRRALRWVGLWLAVLAVGILVYRFTGDLTPGWWQWALGIGVISLATLVGLAWYIEYRNRPGMEQLRAAFDGENEAGGLVMAAAEVDTASWDAKTSNLNLPNVQWRAGSAWMVLVLAAVFLLAAFVIPTRWASFISDPPLEVGQQVQQLQEQVAVLEEEKIVTPEEAETTREEVERIAEEASGFNPAKTLADLDNLMNKHQNLAEQEAAEALENLEALNEAELLAKAIEAMPKDLQNEKLMEEALKKLGDMMGELKDKGALDPEKLDPKIQEALKEAMEELMEQANGQNGGEGMDPQKMEDLLEALKQNKDALQQMAEKLKQNGLIPPEMAQKMQQGMDPDQLEEMLQQAMGELGEGGGDLDQLLEEFREMQFGGNGGLDRGPGAAPMTFGDPASEDGTDFKEQKLAPNAPLDQSLLQGVTQSTPEVTGADAVLSSGALNKAGAGGGSAITAPTLPRHRDAVFRFNKRTGKDNQK